MTNLARIPYPLIDVEVTEPVDPTDGKVPPHDLDAEAAVLSALILDGPRLSLVEPFLRPEHFWSEAHRWIYSGILGCKREGCEIDIVSVANWLKRHARIDQVGGVGYMTELLNATPHVPNVQHHARAVFDAYRLRQAIEVCQRAVAEGYVRPGNPQEFLDGVARALTSLGRMNLQNPQQTNLETVKEIIREIQAANAERERTGQSTASILGLPSGIETYDALTGGMHPGTKSTIVARPGHGKTALGLQIALHCARRGVGVLFFETEMTRKELVRRALAHLGSVDLKRITDANLGRDDWSRVTTVSNELAKLPIRIDATPAMNPAYIRAQAHAALDFFRVEHGVPLGLIVVDYLQRLQPAPGYDRAEKVHRVAHAAEQLKILAQEVGIPLVELAQPKVLPKDQQFKDPDMGDIGDSPAAIQRETDRITFIHKRKGAAAGCFDLVVVKDRGGGATGHRVPVRWVGEFQRFVSDGEYRQ
jgi:replicative DNA helicase